MRKSILKFYDSSQFDLSCSETILHAANERFDMHLPDSAFHIMAPFSGGMMIEDTCGALTGSIAVLGLLFTDNVAHNSPRLKVLVKEFFENFTSSMNSVTCSVLKENYRSEQSGCLEIILLAGEILESIITRELKASQTG